MNIKRVIVNLIGLILLQFLIDMLFVFIYPTVNPIRASFIGVTALAVLFGVYSVKKDLVNPIVGALSIFSSALFGALLVQSGYLASKSPLSGLVHALILIFTYLIIEFVRRKT